MMNFKNDGFSLIEALIAIAIVGLTLTPIFSLETRVFNSVARLAEQFHRTLQAAQFSFIAREQEPAEAKEYTLEKKDEKPLSMITYQLKPVNQKSSLAKNKGMYRREIIASGLDKDAPEGKVIQFIFKPDRSV